MIDFLTEAKIKILSKRTVIITFLFGLFSALSSLLLYHSMEGFKNEVKESKIALRQMTDQVNVIEGSYKEQVHYWIQKNSLLNEQIHKTEFELAQSKQKESNLQFQIQHLIVAGSQLKDTVAIVQNCDSIKQDVGWYISEVNTRDSLCDNEVAELKTVIRNKDSAMATCDRHFTMLKQVTDSSFALQGRLNEDLKEANKKIRRGNIKSKFLAAGVMILGGTTTFLLLTK